MLLHNSVTSGFAVEAILTFFLVTVIFMTAVHKKEPAGMYGLAIGRHDIFDTSDWRIAYQCKCKSCKDIWPCSDIWILENYDWMYWAAPIVGGIIVGLVMNYIFVKKSEQEAAA